MGDSASEGVGVIIAVSNVRCGRIVNIISKILAGGASYFERARMPAPMSDKAIRFGRNF